MGQEGPRALPASVLITCVWLPLRALLFFLPFLASIFRIITSWEVLSVTAERCLCYHDWTLSLMLKRAIRRAVNTAEVSCCRSLSGLKLNIDECTDESRIF